ncbi:MAG: hypothetical protein GX442_14560 [Candidatus Riflebacteria bacterium]|nr:hypothetical protein [Candidatus Riflebacteria bacterium]
MKKRLLALVFVLIATAGFAQTIYVHVGSGTICMSDRANFMVDGWSYCFEETRWTWNEIRPTWFVVEEVLTPAPHIQAEEEPEPVRPRVRLPELESPKAWPQPSEGVVVSTTVVEDPKTVHVDAYTKKDGTSVREHWRRLPKR